MHEQESYLPNGTAEQIDEKLTALAVVRAGQDYEEGRWLLAAFRSSAHRGLGFASFEEYVERRFGYYGRTLQEKLRVAEALADLSACREALASGKRSWSAIREITRVATDEDEQRWLAETEGLTVRDIQRLVASKSDPEKTRVLRFEVPPEVFALWLDAAKQVRKDAGGKLDQAGAFEEVLRRALGGGTDESRSPYQVAVQRCPARPGYRRGKLACRADFAASRLRPACETTSVVAGGEQIEVSPEVGEMAMCDAQVLPDDLEHDAEQQIPPKVRRAVLRRDHHRCAVPGCRNTLWLDIHHIEHRANGGDHDPDNLVTLCGTHHNLHHNHRLRISGRSSTGLYFAHEDGRPYGAPRSKPKQDDDAYLALRGLDFPATYCKRLLDFTRAHVGANETPEAIVVAALRAHHAGAV